MAEYLKEKDLLDILEKYRNDKTEANEFITAIGLIAKNLMLKYKFYSTGMGKEDFIQEAIMICLMKQHNFRYNKGSCFSYFTTVILNHWKYTWNMDKRYYDLIESLKKKMREEDYKSYKMS